MAFKLDWDKIRNQTPEEAEALREETYQRLLTQMQVKIDARSTQIREIQAHAERLNDWERGFMHSMEYLIGTFDLGGVQGGKLADLSSDQTRVLDRLHRLCTAGAKPRF